MKKWLLLMGAVLSEATGTTSLKAALDNSAWYVLVILGFVTAFAFLAAALRSGLALGVAYGIWGATGVALTAGLGVVIFDEQLTELMLLGIGLIIAGVLAVQVGSHRADTAESSP